VYECLLVLNGYMRFILGSRTWRCAVIQLSLLSPCSSTCPNSWQASALKAWGGKQENWKACQEALSLRARLNSEATLGKGDVDGADGESLYVKDYKY
jgi:fructose-bisphosphate aldolase class I